MMISEWLAAFTATFSSLGVLPSLEGVETYQSASLSQIVSEKGQVVSHYVPVNRIFVPLDEMPSLLLKAFVSAEDKNFEDHKGVDFVSTGKAVVRNILSSRGRLAGGSTITQQLVKNLYTGDDYSYSRKIKEGLTARRVEARLDKDKILELYLNEIYLGYGAYGVSQAAQTYFQKDLKALNLSEIAFLAGLPKAPSRFDPIRAPQETKNRRSYVLDRLETEGFSSTEDVEAAKERALPTPKRIFPKVLRNYYLEQAKQEGVKRFPTSVLKAGGLVVETYYDEDVQKTAREALQKGLRQIPSVWEGPAARLRVKKEESEKSWLKRFYRTSKNAPQGYDLALVLGQKEQGWSVHLKRARTTSFLERSPLLQGSTLKKGDLVYVQAEGGGAKKKLSLIQFPKVSGALVVMEAKTGHVLASVGGYDYNLSHFNRVIQAKRQPGSSFKPFVYLAAFEKGFPLNTGVNDAPLEIGTWKPANYDGEFLGPISLTDSFAHSRNIPAVKVARAAGIDQVESIVQRLKLLPKLPPYLPVALGTEEIRLLDLVRAYGAFANGGFLVEPSLLKRVKTKEGQTLYDATLNEGLSRCVPLKGQQGCTTVHREAVLEKESLEKLKVLFNAVLEQGTAKRTQSLTKVKLQGAKTGTTNDYKDAWFIGFTDDLVVGAYVGYDTPASLGKGMTGGRVAGPIVADFLNHYADLKGTLPLKDPQGLDTEETAEVPKSE